VSYLRNNAGMNTKNDTSKKEIRLKVATRLYDLLKGNADVYGVKANDYILHLILNDIKTFKVPYLSTDQEKSVNEAYKEVEFLKSNSVLQGQSAESVMNEIL